MIEALWLQGNDIGQEGAYKLAGVLSHDTSLLKLSLLGCNSLTERGAEALTRSLSSQISGEACSPKEDYNSSLSQMELPDIFMRACERGTAGYDSIKERLKWFADYRHRSVVNLSGKKVDCELLGESVIRYSTSHHMC